MALCIACLCISSFSASFCKRNIIKIIMKIRFCELSFTRGPVFMALLVPSRPHLLSSSLGSRWGLDPAETLGMSQSRGWAWGDPRWSSGGPRWITGGRTHPKPSREPRVPQLLQEQDPLLPTHTPEQILGQCFGTAFPLRWPLQLFRWRTCPAHAQHLLHARSAAEPKFCPCPDPTDPPDLLLPSIPQCSVGLCGILKVCKKSQVFPLHKETKHSPPSPSFFNSAAIQWWFWKQQSSIWNYLKG